MSGNRPDGVWTPVKGHVTVNTVGVTVGSTDSDRSLAQLRGFASELRQWQLDSGGPSIRELARLMKDAGKPFPRSTISDKLAGVSPPSWDFVETFLDACARFQPSRPRSVDAAAWRVRYDLMVAAFSSQRRLRRATETEAVFGESGRGPAYPARPVPREIPAVPSRFTGRVEQMHALDVIRTQAGIDGVPVALITGTAGIGKTALAISWSHVISDAYPDGQVFLNLRGYDPANRLTAAEALAAVLRSFGIPDNEMPDDPEERAGRLRTVLSDRRALLFLDNAASLEQIRHLLPAHRGCIAIVTSRDTLPGLVALHGARLIRLQPLPIGHSVALLSDMIGAKAVDAGTTVIDLATRCAGIPLALRIVGEIALASPTIGLEDLARRLARPDQLLDGLTVDDDTQINIRAAFAWSYRQLRPAAARMFRLLGIHPGINCDEYAAAALAGIEPGEAVRLLGELHRAHLVEHTSTQRISMHDLLRAYAIELGRLAPPDENAAATGRLHSYYLATAATAMDHTFPADRDRRPPVAVDGPGLPEFTDRAHARAWLDTELPNLMAVAHGTSVAGHAYVVPLSAIIWRYMDSAACHLDAIDLQQRASTIARTDGDRGGEALALARLGRARIRLGQCTAAVETLDEALRAIAEVGDRRGEGDIHNTLGLAHEQLGNWTTAGEHLTRAVDLAREHFDVSAEAGALTNLSRVLRHTGELDAAEQCLIESIRLSRGSGDLVGEGRATAHLGFLHYLRGSYTEANRYEHVALQIFVAADDPLGQAWALGDLGRIFIKQNDIDAAYDHHHRALELFTIIGDAIGQAVTHDSLAAIHLRRGESDLARRHWQTSLELARASGQRLLESSVLVEMAAGNL